MISALTTEPLWPSTLRRYIVASAVLHLVWEIAQLPLYTIWLESLGKRAFAVLHCTIGDLMIAGLSLLAPSPLSTDPTGPLPLLGTGLAPMLQ
jgi:hypothetical protein